jgi:hypothetical protein
MAGWIKGDFAKCRQWKFEEIEEMAGLFGFGWNGMVGDRQIVERSQDLTRMNLKGGSGKV